MLQVDAFTTEPFAGNPAAVCLLDAAAAKQLCPKRLQQVAAENNQPATAFVTLLNQDDNYDTSAHFGLSWFSAKVQLPLCGHGTLAASTVLFEGLLCLATAAAARAQPLLVCIPMT